MRHCILLTAGRSVQDECSGAGAAQLAAFQAAASNITGGVSQLYTVAEVLQTTNSLVSDDQNTEQTVRVSPSATLLTARDARGTIS